MTVIAMTREMGTLGKEVAREFARRMNHAVVHLELVASPAERSQYRGESEVYRFLEGSEAEQERWRTNRASLGYLTPVEVLEIAREGDALIRGWGATRLLKSVPGVLSVRVRAPMDFRVEQMRSRLGVDARTARREIERSDAAHGRTFLRFFETDWRDPDNFDIVLNTAHLTPDACAGILCETVASPAFAESDAGRRVMTDRLLEARISQALVADPDLQNRGRNIRIVVDDANVRLFGVVSDGVSRKRAEDLVTALPDVRTVCNEIVRASGFVS